MKYYTRFLEKESKPENKFELKLGDIVFIQGADHIITRYGRYDNFYYVEHYDHTIDLINFKKGLWLYLDKTYKQRGKFKVLKEAYIIAVRKSVKKHYKDAIPYYKLNAHFKALRIDT